MIIFSQKITATTTDDIFTDFITITIDDEFCTKIIATIDTETSTT